MVLPRPWCALSNLGRMATYFLFVGFICVSVTVESSYSANYGENQKNPNPSAVQYPPHGYNPMPYGPYPAMPNMMGAPGHLYYGRPMMQMMPMMYPGPAPYPGAGPSFGPPGAADYHKASPAEKEIPIMSNESLLNSPKTVSIFRIQEQDPDDFNSCVVVISAATITDGKALSLKAGAVQIFGNIGENHLKITAVGKARFLSKNPLDILNTLYMRAAHKLVVYMHAQVIPDGCLFNPYDPVTAHAVSRNEEYLLSVTIKLSREIFAIYQSSTSETPNIANGDDTSLKEISEGFKQYDECLFAGHVKDYMSGDILFKASLKKAIISVQHDPNFTPVTFVFPVECVPTSHDRIVVWLNSSLTGTTVVFKLYPQYRASDDYWDLIPRIQ